MDVTDQNKLKGHLSRAALHQGMRTGGRIGGIAAFCALLAFATMEILAALFFLIDRGKLPYGGQGEDGGIQVQALQVADAVFQPYVGYVLRPGRIGDYLDDYRWQANNRGYHNLLTNEDGACCDYPYVPEDNEVIVGIFGGSVGSGYALSAQIAGGLDGISSFPQHRGKTIRVLNFALPGYKQPQQLMVLAYYLNLGQHFDYVVHIDGFNEAVTTFRNWDGDVEPTFPADTLWGAWGRQLDQRETPKGRFTALARYHSLAAQADKQSAVAQRIATFKLFLEARAGWHGWRASANSKSEGAAEIERAGYFPTQMASPLPDQSDIWQYTVDVWARASADMASLSARYGAAYVHILQPNQWDRATGDYVPISPDHPYEWVIKPVNSVYPKMRSAALGPVMTEVEFLDLSGIFASGQSALTAREAYVDDCCHYTQAGNEIIFAATVDALRGMDELEGR